MFATDQSFTLWRFKIVIEVIVLGKQLRQTGPSWIQRLLRPVMMKVSITHRATNTWRIAKRWIVESVNCPTRRRFLRECVVGEVCDFGTNGPIQLLVFEEPQTRRG